LTRSRGFNKRGAEALAGNAGGGELMVATILLVLEIKEKRGGREKESGGQASKASMISTQQKTQSFIQKLFIPTSQRNSLTIVNICLSFNTSVILRYQLKNKFH